MRENTINSKETKQPNPPKIQAIPVNFSPKSEVTSPTYISNKQFSFP